MNLRLDKNSIRFRLELSEAQALLQEGLLTEHIPWGENALTLKLTTVDQEKLHLSPFHENRLEFFIPHLGLERLLSNAGQKSGKNSLELTNETIMKDRHVEVRFEIDHFSRNQSSKQQSKTNQ